MNKVFIRSVPALYRRQILIPVWIFLTAAGAVLAEKNFAGLFSGSAFSFPRGLILFAALPLLLIVFSCIYLYRLYCEAGSIFQQARLKRFLFFAFLLMGLFSVILPGGIISGFFSVTGEQLNRMASENGSPAPLAVVTEYYDQKLRTLERIASQHMSIRAIQQYRERPAELWPLILAEDPRGICYQVFRVIDEDYTNQEPLFGIGDSHYFLDSSPQNTFLNGILPRSIRDETDLVRYVTTDYNRDELLICVYTSSFIPGFDYVRETLRLNYEKSLFRGRLEQNFALLSILLYVLAFLPGLIFFIVIAYTESIQFSSPLSLLFDHLKDASKGEKNRILTLDSMIYRDVVPVIEKSAISADLPPLHERDKYSLNALLVEVRGTILRDFPGKTLDLHFCQPEWCLLIPQSQTRQIVTKLFTTLFTACSGISVSARNVRRGSLPYGRLIINWSSAKLAPPGKKAAMMDVLTEIHQTVNALNGYVYFLEEDDESGVCFIDFPARTG